MQFNYQKQLKKHQKTTKHFSDNSRAQNVLDIDTIDEYEEEKDYDGE